MADTKISALTSLTGANTDAASDVLVIDDTSVTTTKKILVSELLAGQATTSAFGNASTSLTMGHISGTNVVQGSTTFRQPLTVSSTLSVTGVISSLGVAGVAKIALSGTGTTSGAHSAQFTNTGGTAIFGLESAGGQTFMNGSITYDLSIVGPNGISFSADTGTTRHMNISPTGTVTVAGALAKGSGSFRIQHPLSCLSETHDLVHSFIEGPQVDLIYRGSVKLSNGSATVNLDEHSHMTEGTFVVLCRDVQCFTSNESDWSAVKGVVNENILSITSEDSASTATVTWMVIGERQDQNIRGAQWTDEEGRVIVEPIRLANPQKE